MAYRVIGHRDVGNVYTVIQSHALFEHEVEGVKRRLERDGFSEFEVTDMRISICIFIRWFFQYLLGGCHE